MLDRIHPGDVVARRYRMIDLLHENEGGTFWRAYDQILARSVAFHLIAADDPRAELLLDAARRSATVSDTRILRVLDADEVDGRCYVVNEWGNGRSLDLILTGEGPLPARRAAWIVSEVADTLALGHAQGQAHGRLVPENVLIDHNGSVKIIGFALDAALHGLPPGRRSADVTDLVAVLYAALTGRWAGISRSSLPPAPQLAGHPLRPRKVKAGIPRALDRLCEEVLNPLGHTSGTHARTVETAAQVHDTLVAFVGSPDDVAAVEAGEVALARAALTDTGASLLAGLPSEGGRRTPPAADEQAVEPCDDAEDDTDTGDVTGDDDTGDDLTDDIADPDATVAGVPDYLDNEWHRPRPDKPPPPPRLEQPPEKPLFDPDPVRRPRPDLTDPQDSAAPTGPSSGSGSGSGPGGGSEAGGRGLRRVRPRGPHPSGEQPSGGLALDARPGTSQSPRQGERTGRGKDYWPFTGTGSGPLVAVDQEPAGAVPGRSWLRLAAVIGVVVVVLAAVIIVRSLGTGTATPTATTPSSTSPTTSPTRASQVLTIRSAEDFDPQGDPPEENPDQTGNAVDGSTSTAWTTMIYRQQLGPRGLKDGVGLVLDLGAPRSVTQITVDLVGAPTAVSLFLSDRAPTGVPKGRPVHAGSVADRRLTASLTPPTRARYVLVWLTALPRVPGGYQGGISEVTVRS